MTDSVLKSQSVGRIPYNWAGRKASMLFEQVISR